MRKWTLCALMLTLVLNASAAGTHRNGWWPVQRAPKGVVRVTIPLQISPSNLPPYYNGGIVNGPTHMLAESLAGLAAKAVNEGRSDEMIWMVTQNLDYEDWYFHAMRRMNLTLRGELSVWETAERLARAGIVKGYILYRQDRSPGESNAHRPGMDLSINVATSLAGLLDGAVVEESLEAEAKAHGLKLLCDARDKTQQWVFAQYRDQFSRKMLCTQDPVKMQARDLAIAHKALTIYGYDEPTSAALAWIEPLSPVLGWNGGDEYKTTMMSSVYGQIQTATDWCMNLPLLMAGSEEATVPMPRHLDPRSIDWNDTRAATSFVISDGDNVQWYMGGFIRSQGEAWYGNPLRGLFPYGWSSCFAHLTQLSPETLAYTVETQTANDEFIEWGGGYFYPDRFATKRADRDALITEHARRTWTQMQRTGTRIIAFNFSSFTDPETVRFCELYAREMPGLLGIMAFQYAPYEGGAGAIHWVKDRQGVAIPVVSTRYSIWAHTNQNPRSGTPAKVAREVRETAERARMAGKQNLDWVITHAWSYFKEAPGTDEDAENMDQKDAPAHGGIRGYTPVAWCVKRLPETIRVVAPEELLWRIRMQHDAAQTKAILENWEPDKAATK